MINLSIIFDPEIFSRPDKSPDALSKLDQFISWLENPRGSSLLCFNIQTLRSDIEQGLKALSRGSIKERDMARRLRRISWHAISIELESHTKTTSVYSAQKLADEFQPDRYIGLNIRSEDEKSTRITEWTKDDLTSQAEKVDINKMKSDRAYCSEVMGRAVRYSNQLVVYERYLGTQLADAKSIKNEQEEKTPQELDRDISIVQKVASAIDFIVEAWRNHSPLSSDQLRINIFTECPRGYAGSRDDIFNLEMSGAKTIQQEISYQPNDKGKPKVNLQFKDFEFDNVMLDRYLAAGKKTYAVQHGLDLLGDLIEKNFSGRRRTFFIRPDCQESRDQVAEYRKLRNSI